MCYTTIIIDARDTSGLLSNAENIEKLNGHVVTVSFFIAKVGGTN